MFQAGKIKEGLIIRSDDPTDFETPVSLLDKSWITPNDIHYVRTHIPTPRVSLDSWNLTLDGEVERPQKFNLDDLKQFPESEHIVTLECSGNGRAFHDPHVPGIQWEKGAVGTARWTGVRLADVLKKAGVKPGGKHVVMNGVDEPIGNVPDFIRSIPIEKAFHPDTLLAYRMNGEPIPLLHGYPLRVIVPGWEAANSVKWIQHLTLSEKEAEGHFMKNAYRVPNHYVPPGSAVDPSDMIVYTDLDVKSIFTAPLDGASARAGSSVELRGFAWAGEADVVRVEVSADFGRTWKAAELGPEKARYAWRRWRYAWRPDRRGSYVSMCRATDSRGRTQPIAPAWNPSGYMWNVIDRVRINVEV